MSTQVPDGDNPAMDVHSHGSEDGPGLGCPETRQPDGTLLGYCQRRGGGPVTERLSDLSDDALAWIAERPGVASDERVTEIATELLALRAQQAPTTDEPAAWGLVDDADTVVSASHYRLSIERLGEQRGQRLVPLHRHPAPATDEETVKRAVIAFIDARPRETDMDDMTGQETWDAAPQWWRDNRTRQMRAAIKAAQGGGDRG